MRIRDDIASSAGGGSTRMKVTSPGPALFSAADEAASGFLSQDAFQESLLYHVLFANKLLLHEAYFYNSSFLLEHIRRTSDTTSLFEEAAKAGLVIPAFRDRNTKSLRSAGAVLKDAYGDVRGAIPEKLEPAHYRIICAVDKGICLPKCGPAYWPEPGPKGKRSMGSGYERIVRKLLSSPEPPIRDSDSPDRKQLNRAGMVSN